MVSKEQEIKQIEQTKMLVELFLETNESDIDLAKRCELSSSTVGRRLTNREKILKAFPNNGDEIFETVAKRRRENLERGKCLGGQTSILNNAYLKNSTGKFYGSTKLRLDLFYRNPEQQMKFLTHIALRFRARIPLLSKLFQIDERELLNKMFETNYNIFDSLRYLFFNDETNQEEVASEILKYYTELLNALRNKNNEEVSRLIRMVTDADASELIKIRKEQTNKIKKAKENGEVISTNDYIVTEEQILTMLNYQLKYGLSSYGVGKIFLLDYRTYIGKVSIVLDKNPQLKIRYYNLKDYLDALKGNRRHA